MSRLPQIRVPSPRAVWVGMLFAMLLPFTACERNVKPGQIGGTAPDFTVADTDHTVKLSSFRGKIVVLNFWASWCIPCVEEMPSLQTLQEKLPNVQVLAVSTDEDGAAYKRFLDEHRILFLTVRDAQQKSNALYGSLRFPETYIIDRKGVIRRKLIGAQDWASPEMITYLSKL